MQKAPAGSSGEVTALPRGGLVVKTSAGLIQFGIPPETVKDSMAPGREVPTFYVVPHERFDRRRGINVSEVEFPAYYNFFILKRRVSLIVESKDVEDRIRRVFQETLFGPTSYPGESEFAEDYPRAQRPDLQKESDFFRTGPKGRMEVDTLLSFITFDAEGRVKVSDQVSIERLANEEGYVVRDGSSEVARVPARVALAERREVTALPQTTFEPPAFGMTVLGSSHGFDPSGKTTGFVLWINHRGILVDPPVDSTELLRQNGVAPKLIDGVILSHCHADHDSGTFQKILEEGRVVLYTTPCVLGCFLRKYGALSGLDEDFLRRTFVFRPVKIGAPIRVHGAELQFFYTLHSIPTVGFEAFYGGKSLVFSADTLYDPARIQELADKGVISEGRKSALINFPWHHTVIFHEAGVPPLHTPSSVLAALPDDVKGRLYLTHMAEKDLPKDKGLKVARSGIEHTIKIAADTPRHADAIELLDVICGVDLFRNFPISRAREVLQVARRIRYSQGTKIIAEGSFGECFYLIVSGVASVVQGGKEIKTYQSGDYFGETALILGQPRNADVFAKSVLDVVEIDRYDFLYLLRGTDIPERLVRLARMRTERSWEIFEKNAAFRQLTSAQKTQLQSFLEPRTVAKGEALWRAGEPATNAFIIDEGAVAIEGAPLEPFRSGAFLGEVDAIRDGKLAPSTARVIEAGRVFRISRGDLLAFFGENPGILLSFLGTRFVE
jgi:CRP-like cAMP-binding protein/glyoxylase-like metal-dependent hydrolase (beta-lactamase superfamily II)